MLPFPSVDNIFNEDLIPINERITSSTKRFLDEFVWYIEAFKNQGEMGVPY